MEIVSEQSEFLLSELTFPAEYHVLSSEVVIFAVPVEEEVEVETSDSAVIKESDEQFSIDGQPVTLIRKEARLNEFADFPDININDDEDGSAIYNGDHRAAERYMPFVQEEEEGDVNDKEAVTDAETEQDATLRGSTYKKFVALPSAMTYSNNAAAGASGPSVCDICHKTFSDAVEFNAHMQMHDGEYSYICHVCNKLFKTARTLSLHVRKHMGETPCACQICGETFEQACELAVHLSMHSKQVKRKCCMCHVCGKDFETASNLASHLRMHTGKRPYVCKLCSKTCLTSSGLSEHMHCHAGFRPYQCEVCAKTFTHTYKLEVHMVRHTHRADASTLAHRGHSIRKQFSCPLCKKWFASRKQVRIHVRVHTGERPYACAVCGKRFKQQCHIDQHMRTHTGERPYACLTCNKTYQRSSLLVGHVRVHSDSPLEQHYLCQACDRKLTAEELIHHLKNKHVDNKPFVCPVCGSTFARKFDFHRHIREREGHGSVAIAT